MYQDDITIVVAARNEESTIFSTLSSLSRSAKALNGVINCELIVVVNGCTDNTRHEAERFLQTADATAAFSLARVRNSEPGLITAQRHAVENRTYGGPILFFDADIVVSEDCIPQLVEALKNPQIQIAYARNIAVLEKSSLIVQAINFHHLKQDARTPRRYFHGRAFALRRYPAEEAFHGNAEALKPSRHSFLDLKAGPLVDDVFLSRVFAHHNGPDCMKECGAVVYFTPIATLRDFYHGLKRLQFELRRLDLLFPEHEYLQKTIFERRIDNHLYSRLTRYDRVTLHFGLLLEIILRQAVAVEFKCKICLLYTSDAADE